MSEVAIRVDGLGKRYHLSGSRTRYRTLRETLSKAATGSLRSAGSLLRPRGRTGKESVWALKDVSFEVKQGEAIGLIGRNGAGKSTLLKVLSRITEPTTGFAEIKGRVGSLLEVGTGFHPELSGRENIYLNGAILGMKSAEIGRKFDEIVAFSEVERFIDTPVKHYSSGMYLRLAFAVAAHLETEVLLVDEVLAVGDATFQRKCLGKMNDVARQGRTVLFVSHNMGAISQLCTSAIVLRQGEVIVSGPAREMVDWYLATQHMAGGGAQLEGGHDRRGDGRLRFTSVSLLNDAGQDTANPVAGHAVDIALDFLAEESLSQVQFYLTIHNQMGVAVTHCNVDSSGRRLSVAPGPGQVICHIPKLPLPYGEYKISLKARDDRGTLDVLPTACVFTVDTSDFFPSPYTPPMRYSAALVEHSWKLN